MDDNPETQLASMNETPAPAKSRRWPWVVLGVGLVVVLAAAAFLGGRYLQKSPSASSEGNGMSLTTNGEGGAEQKTYKIDIIPAEELPKTLPDARGIFVRRQDNSIFVGTGKVTFMMSQDANGNTDSGSDYDGPLVEVVTTANTQIYRDATDLSSLPSSNASVQQKVAPGDLDEVGQASAVQAWGKKVGDRLVADVLVYTLPAILNAPMK